MPRGRAKSKLDRSQYSLDTSNCSRVESLRARPNLEIDGCKKTKGERSVVRVRENPKTREGQGEGVLMQVGVLDWVLPAPAHPLTETPETLNKPYT